MATHINEGKSGMLPTPLHEKLSGIENQVERIRSYASLWSLWVGQANLDSLNEEQKKGVSNLFVVNGAHLPDQVNTSKQRIGSMRSHLWVTVFALADMVNCMESALTRVRGLIASNQFNPALSTLIDIEQRDLPMVRLLVDQFERTVTERVRSETHTTFALGDLLCADLYESVFRRISRRFEAAPTAMPLFPLLSRRGVVDDAAWIGVTGVLRDRFVKDNSIRFIPVSSELKVAEWDGVQFVPLVLNRLFAELNLFSELHRAIISVAPRAALSPASTRVLSIWANQLVLDIAAVMVSGPAYVSSCIEHCALSHDVVRAYLPQPGCMPLLLRWQVQLAALRAIGFYAEAENFQRQLDRFYGPIEFATQYPASDPLLLELCTKVEGLVRGLLEVPFGALSAQRLGDCLPVYDLVRHEHAVHVADRIIQQSGITPVVRFSTVTAEKGEVEDPAKGRARKVSAHTGATSDVQIAPIPALIAGCRLAYDHLPHPLRVTERFVQSVRDVVTEFERKIEEGPEGRRLQCNFSREEIERMVRQLDSRGPAMRGSAGATAGI